MEIDESYIGHTEVYSNNQRHYYHFLRNKNIAEGEVLEYLFIDDSLERYSNNYRLGTDSNIATLNKYKTTLNQMDGLWIN